MMKSKKLYPHLNVKYYFLNIFFNFFYLFFLTVQERNLKKEVSKIKEYETVDLFSKLLENEQNINNLTKIEVNKIALVKLFCLILPSLNKIKISQFYF